MDTTRRFGSVANGVSSAPPAPQAVFGRRAGRRPAKPCLKSPPARFAFVCAAGRAIVFSSEKGYMSWLTIRQTTDLTACGLSRQPQAWLSFLRSLSFPSGPARSRRARCRKLAPLHKPGHQSRAQRHQLPEIRPTRPAASDRFARRPFFSNFTRSPFGGRAFLHEGSQCCF